MDGAAGAETLELRHLEALMHHALAGEGGVAMQEEAHDLGAVAVILLRLLGPHLAEHHRVHRLQMGRVGGEAEMHVQIAGKLPVR